MLKPKDSRDAETLEQPSQRGIDRSCEHPVQQQRKDSAERIVGRRFTVALQSTALNALRSQSTQTNIVEQADDDGANVSTPGS